MVAQNDIYCNYYTADHGYHFKFLHKVKLDELVDKIKENSNANTSYVLKEAIELKPKNEFECIRDYLQKEDNLIYQKETKKFYYQQTTNVQKEFPREKVKLLYDLQVPVTLNIFEDGGGEVNIRVKLLTGKEFEITNLAITSTIFELKTKIKEKEFLPQDQQRLIFKALEMEDNKRIKDYEINNGDMIHLVLRLRGGMFVAASGFDDERMTNFTFCKATVNAKEICFHPNWTVSEFIQRIGDAMENSLLSPFEFSRQFFEISPFDDNFGGDFLERENRLQARSNLLQRVRPQPPDNDNDDDDDDDYELSFFTNDD